MRKRGRERERERQRERHRERDGPCVFRFDYHLFALFIAICENHGALALHGGVWLGWREPGNRRLGRKMGL